MDKKQKLWIVGSMLVVLVLMTVPEEPLITLKGGWDISNQVEAEGLDIYLVEEPDFDYSHPEVYQVAQDIKGRTSTPKEAVRETLDYIMGNNYF